MPELKIGLAQIEQLINQLTERDKLALVRKLEAKTLPRRWQLFLREIDKRRKKHPVNQHEIEQLVEEVRQDLYERSRR